MSMGTKSLVCSVRVSPRDLAAVLKGLYGKGIGIKSLSSAISWCVETVAMSMEPVTDKQALEVLEMFMPDYLKQLRFGDSQNKVDKFLKERAIKKVEKRLGTTLNLDKADMANIVCLSDEEIKKIQQSEEYKEANSAEETEWEKEFYAKQGIKTVGKETKI